MGKRGLPPDPIVHHDCLLGGAGDGIMVLEEPQCAPSFRQKGQVRERVLASQSRAAGVGDSQAVQNLCPPARERSQPPVTQLCSAPCQLCRTHSSSFPPFSPWLGLRALPVPSKPIQPLFKPQRLTLLPPAWKGAGLTAGGLPGHGPSPCKKAGKCNSLSSNGLPGPRRRRNRHSAQGNREAGPPAPPLSSCRERQNSQRGCQTEPVGTPTPHFHQLQSLSGPWPLVLQLGQGQGQGFCLRRGRSLPSPPSGPHRSWGARGRSVTLSLAHRLGTKPCVGAVMGSTEPHGKGWAAAPPRPPGPQPSTLQTCTWRSGLLLRKSKSRW